MYYIVDIQQDPPVKLDIGFETYSEACVWIDENGGITKFTLTEED